MLPRRISPATFPKLPFHQTLNQIDVASFHPPDFDAVAYGDQYDLHRSTSSAVMNPKNSLSHRRNLPASRFAIANPLINFIPVNCQTLRGVDAKFHAVASDRQNNHANRIADLESL
jgi:hypothetical protein